MSRKLLPFVMIALLAPMVESCATAQPPAGERRGGRSSEPAGQPPAATTPAKEATPTPPKKDEKDKDKEKEKLVTTNHEVTIGGKTVRYTATAGMLPLLDDKGKADAHVFYVAYVRTDLPEGMTRAKRPLTFAFNGGPGSSSVWLHLGALGPRRVKMGADGEMLPPPSELVDNEHSWLDMTDLVFIDPVSTGFSRANEGEDPHQFHGLEEDTRAVGEFIRLWLTRNERWGSPKYLSGESYGTTRASSLAGHLQGRLGIYVNGIVLISPVLNFMTLSFDVGNDTPYPLFLPTYTATAFHHGKLKGPMAENFDRTIDEVRKWADTEYVAALQAGSSLTGEARDAVAEKLSAYTGLSVDYLKRCNLRPTISGFTKELLRDQQRSVGRYDSRYKGIDRLGTGESPDYDPSYSVVLGPFTACLNSYVRGELKFESDLNYEILTGAVQPWKYPQNRFANVSESLRGAMVQNPNLRVLSACGYYDLATPFHAMTYTHNHLGLDAEGAKRLSQTYYKAGHMMYLRLEDLAKLKTDVAKFYEGK